MFLQRRKGVQVWSVVVLMAMSRTPTGELDTNQTYALAVLHDSRSMRANDVDLSHPLRITYLGMAFRFECHHIDNEGSFLAVCHYLFYFVTVLRCCCDLPFKLQLDAPLITSTSRCQPVKIVQRQQRGWTMHLQHVTTGSPWKRLIDAIRSRGLSPCKIHCKDTLTSIL